MTIRALTWAMHQSMPPAHKLMLIYICECSNQEGDSHKTKEELAQFCGITIAKVDHVLADLEASGYIHRRKSSNDAEQTIIRHLGPTE